MRNNMKKIIIFCLAVLPFLTSCVTQKEIVRMCSKRCEIELKNAKVLVFKEDRIILSGDGDEYIVIDLSKDFEEFESAVQESDNWHYFSGHDRGLQCPKNEYFEIPQEGYYCIIDWQQPREKKFDGSQIWAKERYSLNYTVMIYDPAVKKLYSYSLDT